MCRPLLGSPAVAEHPAILLLGPTGAGKTPLGQLLEERGLWGTKWRHFDFGAEMRDAVRRGRPDRWLSAADIDFLRTVLQSGALLEDEQFPLARRIIERFLAERQAAGPAGIVLNGLPRHVGQARAIDEIVDVRAVVQFVCSDAVVQARIRSNVGGDRTQRTDDQPQAIARKLAIYRERTAPLVEHYRRRGARIETLEVAADTTPEQMWDALRA